MKSIRTTLLTLLIFILTTVYFFRTVIFSPGAIVGADWGLPVTVSQMNQAVQNKFFTWTNQGFLFGTRQSTINDLPFIFVIKLFSLFNINGEFYTKFLLVFLFVLAAFSMFLLLKYLKITPFISFLGGLLYITLPIFFNYSIMGWQYALLTLALFPLITFCFIQAVKKDSFSFSLITALSFSLAVMQSQAIIWIPLIFLALSVYLIKDRNTLKKYIKQVSIIFGLFLLLNLYWILNLVIFPDKVISGSDIVNSAVSLGLMDRFQPLDFIRLWGTLSNYMYELAVNRSHMILLSFIVPFIAISALLLKKNRSLILSFWLIGLIPFFLYILNFYRFLLLEIPFSNVIRDFLRFISLSSFAYIVLASFTLDFISQLFKKYRFIIPLCLVILLVLFSPWITDNVGNWYPGRGCDLRLRTKLFPQAYYNVETYFNNKKDGAKALFLPAGSGVIAFNDDKKFHGLCDGTWDIFSGFSSVPGSITISDRKVPYINDFLNSISVKIHKDILSQVSLTDIKYIAVRKNALQPNDLDLYNNLKMLVDKHKITMLLDNDKIALYQVNKYNPHIFIQTTRPISITYKKINSAKYEVNISHALFPFKLIFFESFDPLWRIYLMPQGKKTEIQLSASNHTIVNGYANAWIINPLQACQQASDCIKNPDGSYNFKIVLDFFPQRFLNMEMFVSFVTFFLIIFYFFYHFLIWKLKK